MVGLWSFMDGWHPERLPLAVGLYDIEDVDGMVERLLVLREVIKEHEPRGRP